MKKIQILFIGMLSIFFVSANVFAVFDFQREKAKCSRIKNHAERSTCYTAAYLEKAKMRAHTSRTQTIEGKNTLLYCRLKVGNAAQKKCENAIKAEQKQKVRSAKKTTKKKSKKKTQGIGKKEIFLTILPCEKKQTQLEKVICYNEFYKEQEVKKLAAKKAQSKKKVYVSPTFQRMKCRKITNRKERSQCYIDLKNAEREGRSQKRLQQETNFTETTRHEKCLAMSNALQRAKCFHNLNKVEQRLADTFKRNQENK